MFERFTERARQVVVLAQEEARELKTDYLGSEHILLGLLREEEGLAARVLASMDVEIEPVRRAVVGEAKGSGEVRQIPFTPRAQKVFELSLREALSLGHNYIGTGHILLGLLREGDNLGLRILEGDFGLDRERVRNEVIRMVSGPAKPKRTHPFEAEQYLSQQTPETQVTLDMVATAITLGRQYPEQSTDAIVKAALALHGKA